MPIEVVFNLGGGYESDSQYSDTSDISETFDNEYFSDTSESELSFNKEFENQTYLFDSNDSDDEESLIDNAKKAYSKKYLSSLNLIQIKNIVKENNLKLSSKGVQFKKNQLIKNLMKNK
jgi:hypothetical protein